MKFSLILATVGRIKEVEEFIISLRNQKYKDFELIIVDQNKHDEIYDIYTKYNEYIDIKYVRANSLGLSYARNIGMKYVSGDIVSFPDDDCLYDEQTLEKVRSEFCLTNIDIITFKILDKDTNENSCGNWPSNEMEIDKYNVFNTSISITMFIKIKDIKDINFDESLGVGTKLSSGEETDLVLSLLSKKYKGKYTPQICVYHPNKPKDLSRGYRYALGTGAVYYKETVLRKNYLYIIKYSLSIIKPSFNIFKNLIKLKKELVLYNLSIVNGRINGFFTYKIKEKDNKII